MTPAHLEHLRDTDPAQFAAEVEKWAQGNEDVCHLHADDDADEIGQKMIDEAAWREARWTDGTPVVTNDRGIVLYDRPKIDWENAPKDLAATCLIIIGLLLTGMVLYVVGGGQ